MTKVIGQYLSCNLGVVGRNTLEGEGVAVLECIYNRTECCAVVGLIVICLGVYVNTHVRHKYIVPISRRSHRLFHKPTNLSLAVAPVAATRPVPVFLVGLGGILNGKLFNHTVFVIFCTVVDGIKTDNTSLFIFKVIVIILRILVLGILNNILGAEYLYNIVAPVLVGYNLILKEAFHVEA